jgi:hypothetical protein
MKRFRAIAARGKNDACWISVSFDTSTRDELEKLAQKHGGDCFGSQARSLQLNPAS